MNSRCVVSAGVALLAACGSSTDVRTRVAADYTLSLTPAALNIVQGATGNTTVTISRTNFTDPVTLSIGNVPVGITGSFDPAASTATRSALTVNVGGAVGPGVYNVTVDGTASVGNRSAPLTLTVNSSGGGGSVRTVDAGFAFSCALNASGKAYCWGYNFSGQLGDGTTTQRLVPGPVAGGLTFAALSLGKNSACGVTTSGSGDCWGWNPDGELGDGTTTDRPVPTLVTGGLTLASVSAGYGHTCGVTTTGAAYCWGGQGGQIYGQLGDGTTTRRLVPTAVLGSLTFAAVSAGFFHTCGVTTSGAAYCWGENSSGELGDSTTTNRLVPTPVAGGLVFAALSAGWGWSCGVTTSGAAYCWGENAKGELGDGTTTNRLVPTPVAGGLTFAAVSAGDVHTCGVTTGGAAYCWGDNGFGQLGDGSTTNRFVPTAVGGGLEFAVVSAGAGVPYAEHTCGVTTSGAAYCWGWNGSGQLGDGTTTQRLVPTAVAFP